MTLEIYDVAANYQGEQSGWFGKILKDKFNLKLNIIAPQVSGDGDSLYQTRSASGNLGDIVILDNSDMQDCIEAGLIMDIGDIIGNYENLSRYQEQINLFNGYLQNVDEGSVYAIPCNMNSNGPTAFTGENAGSAPRVPWDYFKEIGCPEMKTSDDLLKALADIQAAHPTNNEGDAAYAISMWKDWDGTSIANANERAQLLADGFHVKLGHAYSFGFNSRGRVYDEAIYSCAIAPQESSPEPVAKSVYSADQIEIKSQVTARFRIAGVKDSQDAE